MTPGARASAAIEVFADIEARKRPASEALKDWGLAHRFAGSGDRAAIGNLVFDALRKRASSAYAMGEDAPRALVLRTLVTSWGKTPEEVAALAERLDAEFTYGMERAAEPGAAFPGGESFAAFQQRIVPAFEALLQRTDWTTALVAGHGGTNAVILAWVTRGGLAGLSAFEQDAGCVNIVDADVVDGEIVRRMLRAVNLTPYNLAKHEHYLTVAERIVAEHRAPAQLAAAPHAPTTSS